ncbi:hypothetical protein QWY28_17525 [Nocardioides sp. SOB77]|uniref:Uncharacterized protein n=1 Tax=Nocardioides oceani TaxID=3058369 RepID=A0ABT8FJB0_9ACTN|nr:hypothetical protein [Nocardioides oceani]MDN4174766.1 hypothetical protein [Nocardioides oceani]
MVVDLRVAATSWGDAAAETCWCMKPVRGPVARQGEVPPHNCLECSVEHCQVAGDLRRCEFGLCRAEAEYVVDRRDGEDPARVCLLHVSARTDWGTVETVEPMVWPLFEERLGAA